MSQEIQRVANKALIMKKACESFNLTKLHSGSTSTTYCITTFLFL